MNKREFTFNISWTFISQATFLFSLFLINIFLGKFLGPSDFGVYTMIYAIFTITSLIGGIGIPLAIVKYIAEFKNKEGFNSLIYCSIINSLIFGAIAGIVLFILSPTLAVVFHMNDLNYLIWLISFLVPLYVVNSTLLGILNGIRKMKTYSIGIIIRSLLLFSLTIILVIYGFGVNGAVMALLISESGTLIFLMIILFKVITVYGKNDTKLKNYFKTTKELLKFGFQLFIAGAIFILNTYTDVLLIGYFLTDTAVGIYGIALTLSKSFMIVSGTLSTVSYPMISEYNSKGLNEHIERLLNKIIRHSFVILSIMAIILVLFSEYIILLINPDYFAAIVPIAILAVGMISFGAMSSVGMSFSSVGRPDIPVKINIISIIINLGLNILLIPLLGINGAAISNSVAFTILTVLCFYLLNKLLNVKIEWLWYVKILAVNITVIVAFLLVREWLNLYYILAILLIYLLFIYKFLLNNQDILEIKEILGHISKRKT